LLLDASKSGEWSDVLKSLLNQTTSIAILSLANSNGYEVVFRRTDGRRTRQ